MADIDALLDAKKFADHSIGDNSEFDNALMNNFLQCFRMNDDIDNNLQCLMKNLGCIRPSILTDVPLATPPSSPQEVYEVESANSWDYTPTPCIDETE